MEHLVDLDALADRLRPVIEEWKREVVVGPLSWRDESSAWPQPIVHDRSGVESPESLGFTLSALGHDGELAMVIWTGGWADVGSLVDGEVGHSCPEFRDIDTAYRAVVAEVTGFLAAADRRR